MSVLPFGPRDYAVDRQEIVDTLHRLLDGNANLACFPENFKLAMRERVWEQDRIFAGGTRQGPISFLAFVHEHYPVGLGATFEVIENLIRGDNEALGLWTEATKRDPGNPTGANQHASKGHTGNVDNINSSSPSRPTGTSKEAGLRRLQKEAEGDDQDKAAIAKEQLALVKAGEKTVHKACVDAGVRKSTKIDSDVRSRAMRELPIIFTIPGDPVAFARSGGNGKVRFTPKRQRDFTALVKLAAHQAMEGRAPLSGPVRLDIQAYYLVPSSWPKKKAAAATWRTSKPDADNVAKLISDSINEIVFVDDAQVAQLSVRKVYGSTSRTLVTIALLGSGGDL